MPAPHRFEVLQIPLEGDAGRRGYDLPPDRERPLYGNPDYDERPALPLRGDAGRASSRWLRIAGYDTAIAEGGRRDRDLVEQAHAEGRILLTRARRLVEIRRGKVSDVLILDDFSRDDLISTLGTPWRGFSDRVMGGISKETVALTEIDGRRCLRLSGDVCLENNGGFIQMALDLAPAGRALDASDYRGVLLVARGNGERYGVHLRTPDCTRPWQSYRVNFAAGPAWHEIRLPFDGFEPYRLTEPLDLRHLRRIGLVAIGRAFRADLAVSAVGLFG